MDIIEKIKSRSKKEWLDLLKEQVEKGRTWIQSHGEQAAIFALVIGIAAVVFYKIVFGLLFIVAIALTVAWLMAPDAPTTSSSSPPPHHHDDSDNQSSGV